jgi:DNA helicase-2/ATP-dependent DNA helicase PcrA
MSDPLEYDPLNAPVPAAEERPAPGHVGQAPYLQTLNDAQGEAVSALDGAVLVLAGAGTGKTRVLTTRLAHLLHQNRARPYQVLAVTFTNKAAREMQIRLGSLIGRAVDGLWLGTFHALGVRILRRHAELVGLKSNFTILDSDDQVRLLKQILEVENIDAKRWPARLLISVIQRWKDKGLTPEKVSAGDAGELANGRVKEIYAQYQARLQTLNAADFGDLLLHCLTLFTSHSDVLADYQKLFHYILVDEYQDTNVAQYLWLRLLAQGHRNICCVGDDDQSIYGWRGAEVGNILKFEKDFPGARVIRLERNYRSTAHILGAASGLIANNESRLGKTLWTEANQGEKISVRGLWDGEEEARLIADEVEALHRKKNVLNEMAILVRAGFQTREFEERFITLGVPYRVIGGPRFYEREEIRDALAYLRIIHMQDDDLAFERIVNKPTRGIGKATIQAIHALARHLETPLYIAAAKLVESDELKPASRNSLGRFIENIDRWRALAEAVSHSELAQTVLDESGYTAFWQNSKNPEAPGKLENLKELIPAIEEYDSLGGFLEHVSLVMENTENSENDMVNLMTLHSAKGLEFDSVFLPGWEEGLFPHQRSLDENGLAGLEEERRLAYVGITRAKKRVMITFAANRRIYNQWQSAIPSRFVTELPEEHAEVQSDSGLYGGDTGSGDTGMEGAGWSRQEPSIGGPGWQRFQKRGPGLPLIEAGAQGQPGGADRLLQGDRCFHQKFGMGVVLDVDGDHLSIDFDQAGTKKVVAAFVEKP